MRTLKYLIRISRSYFTRQFSACCLATTYPKRGRRSHTMLLWIAFKQEPSCFTCTALIYWGEPSHSEPRASHVRCQSSLTWPDRFSPFFFGVSATPKKNGKKRSGHARLVPEVNSESVFLLSCLIACLLDTSFLI